MDTIITSTALPLLKDGAVYHLGLKPGELANTIILVGDPDRVPQVSAYFDEIRIKQARREFVTHTGLYQGLPLSVVSTGIGTSNIDIVLNEIDALHNIDLNTRQVLPKPVALNIIRLGTCGALQADIEPGDYIWSEYAVGFDGCLVHYDISVTEDVDALVDAVRNVLPNYPLHKAIYAAQAADGFSHLKALGRRGITFTSPGFYGPQHRRLRLPLLADDIFTISQSLSYQGLSVSNFEMEAAMIMGLGAALGHQCATLCLPVFNRLTQASISDPYQAMSIMIEAALAAIKDDCG